MASIREREPGVWTIRVSNGLDPVTGKRITAVETFKGSKTRAKARADDFQRTVRKSPVAGGQTTLKQTIALWRQKARHAESTSRNYDLAVRTIPAHLMKTGVGKIRASTVEALDELVLTKHGRERARLVHAVVSGALSYAWRQEWIPENVALKVTPPAPKRRKDSTPTSAEIQKLLNLVVERPQVHAWLLLSAMVGGRPSEILALRWSDIDLDRAQVTISRALEPIGSSGRVKATKTDNERTVAIGALTVGVLRVWHARYLATARDVKARPVRDPYVFVRPATFDGGTPWRPDYGSKEFRKLRDKAGINPRVRRVDLRHYVATILLSQGVALKTVGERMGHTRLATTSDTYAGVIPASDQASADILEAGLAG
jgi:integrase